MPIHSNPLKPLNDYVYPPGNNGITRFDNKMVRLAGKAGTFIQQHTGMGQKTQMTALSTLTMLSFLSPSPAVDPVRYVLRFPLVAYLWRRFEPPQPSSLTGSQMSAESEGKDPDVVRFIRACLFLGGLYSTFLGICTLTGSDGNLPTRILDSFEYAVMPFCAARSYLSLAQFPEDPPKRKPKESLKEIIGNWINGTLQPDLVPAG